MEDNDKSVILSGKIPFKCIKLKSSSAGSYALPEGLFFISSQSYGVHTWVVGVMYRSSWVEIAGKNSQVFSFDGENVSCSSSSFTVTGILRVE